MLHSKLQRNTAKNPDPVQGIGGGAIAAWGGTANVTGSWLARNDANFGGGLLYAGNATGDVDSTTIENSTGGGIVSRSTSTLQIDRSTFSSNQNGAVFRGFQHTDGSYYDSRHPSISADGRYTTFTLTPIDPRLGFSDAELDVSYVALYDTHRKRLR